MCGRACFEYCVCFGKNDYSDWIPIYIDINKEEESAIEKAYKENQSLSELRYGDLPKALKPVMDRAESQVYDEKESQLEEDYDVSVRFAENPLE